MLWYKCYWASVQGHDPVDGDITNRIGACQADALFSTHGLRACALNTSLPGTYSISFLYIDKASEMTLIATRTVVVMQQCSATQQRCADLSCSEITCAGGAYVVPVNTAPKLELLPLPGFAADEVILVPKGWQYTACQAGQSNFASQPCEPGVKVLTAARSSANTYPSAVAMLLFPHVSYIQNQCH